MTKFKYGFAKKDQVNNEKYQIKYASNTYAYL